VKIGLFIPCYINQYYPGVGIATLKLLQKHGFEVDYPTGQTCCGQPLANSGYERYTHYAINHFFTLFRKYDVIVSPSASCILFVKEHLKFQPGHHQKIQELSDFLVEQGLTDYSGTSFPKKVGVLQSCHGLRGLHLGSSTEIVGENGDSTIVKLLHNVSDIQLIGLDRPDDCCGFGGTFSVKEPALSVKMGNDRLDDFIRNGAEVITGTDMSCLMHLEGVIKKQRMPLEVMHFSEIICQE